MPLEMDCAKKAVSLNIRSEIRLGRKPEQAKAIAMSNLARSCGLSIPMQKKAREHGLLKPPILFLQSFRTKMHTGEIRDSSKGMTILSRV